MENPKQHEELTGKELEKVKGGARMAQAPSGKLGSAGDYSSTHGNLGGDIVDSPDEERVHPTQGGTDPLDDPTYHA